MNSNASAIPTSLEQTSPLPAWKEVLSFPVMMVFLLVGGMFMPLRSFNVDPDVWWHIKVGATILATHHLPTTDPYSFTVHGSPWIAYEWLGEMLLAVVQHAWGLPGLMALAAVLTAAIMFALYTLVTVRCGNSKAAFVACAVLVPMIYPSCSLRPQMLGYLFLVLTLIVLERFRRGHTGALWFLPPLFLVWINTHGSFVLGLFALGVYWASGLVEIHWGDLVAKRWTSAQRLHLELTALLILVALTITPYGTELCLYPLNMAFAQPINVSNIQEWQVMPFGEFFGKLFLLLILAFVLAQVALRQTWRLEELVLFLAGVAAACMHVRFVLVFVPFSAPMFATILARWIPPYDPAKDKYALNVVLMALFVGGIVWFFPSRAKLDKIVEQKWPVRAVAYLKQHPVPRPMYNTYGYGGYLVYELDGQNKTFIDGRGDLFERMGVLSDYLTIARLGVAAPSLLNAYGIQSCIIEHDEPLRTFLGNSPDWQIVYSDNVSAIFVRKQTRSAAEN